MTVLMPSLFGVLVVLIVYNLTVDARSFGKALDFLFEQARTLPIVDDQSSFSRWVMASTLGTYTVSTGVLSGAVPKRDNCSLCVFTNSVMSITSSNSRLPKASSTDPLNPSWMARRETARP